MEGNQEEDKIHDITPVSGLYQNWFLDYASYVILERAVPYIEDGLKPVQRRILHSMKEMDDGRYNKVANIIGQTMQYHPHGDAAIGGAMVNLGQKDLLIDTQGNWGDVVTGDNAAAPRYIEARLSKFGLDVLFNEKTTNWQLSYDGRKREPITLPVKFPLLLAQGVEGIAVGLSTIILPHNFIELIEASIDVLKGHKINIFPDFPTGGLADFSNYNEGKRGGKVRIRAKIEELDKKTLVIREIPYSKTTGGVIESIIKANDSGKIKIKKVIDNTAKDVEIQIQLAPGVSPDITIDALYAFTDCEISISPNACVIVNNKPHFLSVNEILRICTEQTKELLRKELEIKRAELTEKIFFSTLLKIFIQEGMYKNPKYENADTDEASFKVLNELYTPHFKLFYRTITNEDYQKVMAKPLSSIRKYDVSDADEKMKALENEIEQVDNDLKTLTQYTIAFYQNLLKKYGKGKERKTEIRTFETISANVVAAANTKLYANFEEGFIGSGLKKDTFICECSDIDDIIAFTKDGKMKVVKMGDKVFIGKGLLYAGVFKKNDDRMVYNMVYIDGKTGRAFAKRFPVTSITRDKEYDLTQGSKGTKVFYFTANPNSEAEVITVYLSPNSIARKKMFDFDFATLAVKGRNSQGNVLTKYIVKKVIQKSKGVSTAKGRDIWFDEVISRLNTDDRGKYLGNFQGNDLVLVITKDGSYELTSFELTNHYENNNILVIEKFNPEKVVTVVHFDGAGKTYYIKRFKIETLTVGKKFSFISESAGSKLALVTTANEVTAHFKIKKGKETEEKAIELVPLIDVKGWKAIGNKFLIQQWNEAKLEITEEEPEEEVVLETEEDDNVSNEAVSEEIKDTPQVVIKPEIIKEVKPEEKGFEPGTTIELEIKKSPDSDQLGLF
jgi:topoisomerase IV subunit A